MPKVAVIILNWNGLPLLQTCLPSVVAFSGNEVGNEVEIVVADNASTDESVQWIQETYPKVRIIVHPENGGYSKGNNEAIRQTESEFVLLLNNDVEVTEHWITSLVALMEQMPDVAAVQPKLLQFQERQLFEYAGASGGFLDRYGYPFTRGRLFFHLEPDEGQYDDARSIFWATGAAILLRRSALVEVGLLDEDFFMHFEEIDLCWRLQRHGWRIMVEPQSVAYHIGGASLPQGNARKTYYNFRNSLLMLYKNMTKWQFRRTFVMRSCIDAIAYVRALWTSREEAKAILNAYRDFLKMKTRYTHPNTTQMSHVKDRATLYPRSIVWAYFVNKKRKFKDLD